MEHDTPKNFLREFLTPQSDGPKDVADQATKKVLTTRRSDSLARSGFFTALALCIGMTTSATTHASNPHDYPSEPIRVIVPFNAGGGTDVVARVVSEAMSEHLGQPVLVDNRPGAQGIIGTKLGADARPDGYTITFVLQATLALNPRLYKATNYDPIHDFTPISQLSNAPYVVVVHPGLGVSSIQELVAKAKQTPGRINYASGAAASHLASLLLQKTFDMRLSHIPYAGSGKALTDLLAGRVSLMLSSPVSILPHIQAGTLLPLAVTSAKRLPSLPDVPTVAELGYSGFEVSGWYGLAAPKGVPRHIVEKLHAAVVRALQTDTVQTSLQSIGVAAHSSTPQAFGALIATETQRWRNVIDEAGIKPE